MWSLTLGPRSDGGVQSLGGPTQGTDRSPSGRSQPWSSQGGGIRLGGDLRRHPVWWFSKVFQGLDACKSPLETLLNIQTLWSYSLSRPRFSASRAENRLLDSPPRVILILMYKHTPVREFLFKSNFLSYSELSIPFSLMTARSSEDLFLTEELEPGEVPLAGLVAGCGRGCWGRNDVRAQGWELGPVEAQ